MSTRESIRQDAAMSGTYARETLDSANAALSIAETSVMILIKAATHHLPTDMQRIVYNSVEDMMNDTFRAYRMKAEEDLKNA